MKQLKIFIKLLETGLNQEGIYKSIFFFRSSKLKLILWCELLKKNLLDGKYTTEKLLNVVSIASNISRPTILKAIDEGIRKNFILKEKNIDDKRKFYISLSELSIIEFKKWAKEIKLSLKDFK